MIEKSGMHYDTHEAYEAQRKYCDEHNVPLFADKYCPHCGKDIFGVYGIGGDKYRCGFSVECAGGTLITGCPFCNYSFCD